MRSYLRPKLHPLFLDAELNDNDIQTLTTNIYQNAIHTAIKSHAYQKELKSIIDVNIRDDILLRIVNDLAKHADRRVKRLCTLPLANGTSLARALVLRAFLEVWKRKPTKYRAIISKLEGQCKLHSIRELLHGGTEAMVLEAGELLLQSIQF